jgi:hypothetical protein
VTETEYVVGAALPLALLYFSYPGLGRIKTPEPVWEAEVPAFLRILGQLVLYIGYYFSGLLSVFFARQYLFNVLHWFAGRGYPSNQVLFFVAIAVPVTTILGKLAQDGGKQLQKGQLPAAVGCLLIPASIILIPLILFCLALTLAGIGFSIYFIRQIGWAAALIGAVSFVGGLVISLLSLWADSLKSKQLEGVYTLIPGGLAALIQFGLSNPNVLPH